MSSSLPTTQTLRLPSTQYAARLNEVPDGSAPRTPSVGMSSHDILRGQKTVEINHNGSTYRLQATRLGKLILTK